ncbi:uncharacterized protein LOC123006378 isoform X2 [Tribolium madens]|uniref:uncharacterized protein LOC123006378 isoform X2 n=1 Tax=Tribolium madens TaxID=41895 RepID=UPI001CF7232C|nr:uncharacterized protein LOC123006378 isoform X2 [Tribolium madens]
MALTGKTQLVINCSQSDYYIHCIINSGVILDEDMECILMHFGSDERYSQEIKLSFLQKLIGGLSLAGTVFLAERKCPVYMLPISASPVLLMIVKTMRRSIRQRTQKRNFEIFVDTVGKIAKLNRMISEYFKHKNVASPETTDIINPYTPAMKKLVELVFMEETFVCYKLRICVRELGNYVPFLKKEFAHVENIEIDKLTSLNIHNINDCVTQLKQLCDIYLLLASNCLTSLTIALSPRIWSQYDVDLRYILELLIPRMRIITEKAYNVINKKFDDLKYYYLNRSQVKKRIMKIKPNGQSKLYMGTCDMMVHVSDIIEKSEIVYKMLQKHNLQTLNEREVVGKCIAELRTHVFDYYEALDILHKFYEINLNQPKPQTQRKLVEIPEDGPVASTSHGDVDDASLNSVEPDKDEEYEAYIGANDNNSDTSTSYSAYEEQESRRYASILGQELKKKLKSHARFVAARQRRGLKEEESEDEASQLPPRFFQVPEPLPPMRIPDPLPNCEPFGRVLVPPPPPPPLPPIDLGGFDDDDEPEGVYTVNHFLDSIKAAAQSRSSSEEVFHFSGSDE